MLALNRNFLRGSYPPLVTPFREGAVDYDAYARMVERQVAEGSHGIVVNGTTAEPSTLSIEERNELVRLAVQTARGRIPVVAATGSQSHADTIELTAAAEKAGADAVLVVTPYFIRPPQRGLVEYYVDIGRRTRLPMLIYHIPGRAAVNVEAATLERIAERAPNLVGMKHAANDLALVTQVLARMGNDFRIFVGLEELSFPMMAIGACGLMNAAGNLKPQGARADVRGCIRRAPRARARRARRAVRAQPGDLLRHQSYAAQIHDEADGAARNRRASPADDAGDA